MLKDSYHINLIHKKNDSLINDFLDWLLSVGRLLIIITEFVALGTFIYRFSFDWQISDLHDKINKSSVIVKYLGTNEDAYKNLQKKLSFIKLIDKSSNVLPMIAKDVIDMGRGNITFKKLVVANDGIQIEAQVVSISSLKNFVNSLKSYPYVSHVSINSIKNNTSLAIISVSITGSLKLDKILPSIPQNPSITPPAYINSYRTIHIYENS